MPASLLICACAVLLQKFNLADDRQFLCPSIRRVDNANDRQHKEHKADKPDNADKEVQPPRCLLYTAATKRQSITIVYNFIGALKPSELRKHFSKERYSWTAMPFFAVFSLYCGLLR